MYRGDKLLYHFYNRFLMAMAFASSIAEYALARSPIFAGSVVKTTDLTTDFVDLPTHSKLSRGNGPERSNRVCLASSLR